MAKTNLDDCKSSVEKQKYESPLGFHRHQCGKCKYVWEHSNNCIGDDSKHKCPNCGEEEWVKYFGKNPLQKNDSCVLTINNSSIFYFEILLFFIIFFIFPKTCEFLVFDI